MRHAMTRHRTIRGSTLLAALAWVGPAWAQGLAETLGGSWAIGSPANCARSAYEWSFQVSGNETIFSFRDKAGRVNTERVLAQGLRNLSSATLSSPEVPAGTRWDYTVEEADRVTVRNLATGRQFALVRCAPSGAPSPPLSQGKIAPTFADPVSLVTWLLQNSGRGFDPSNDDATANVFSPGLRSALRATYQRSRRRNEPPCGANGDIIRETQEDGTPTALRVSAQNTAPDRVSVHASFDVDGYHRDRRFLTVQLDGNWKLENIVSSDGTSSLRRNLECR